MLWPIGTHIMQPLSMWSLLAYSHSLSLSLSFFFSLTILLFFTHIFSLFFFFFLSFFSNFTHIFSLFFSLFSARQNQHHPWYRMNLLWGAHRSPPHLDFCALRHQSQVCDVGISKCIPPTGGTKCAVGAVLMSSCIACPLS